MKYLSKQMRAIRKTIGQDKEKKVEILRNFEEAKKHRDAYLIMEGDYGGQIYLSIPVSLIKCNKTTIDKLLHIIDSMQWDDAEGASTYFERLERGEIITGGMNGGETSDSIWVHEDLNNFRDIFLRVLSGEKEIDEI